MIEKLRKKIFYLVFISLTIIVLGVIILFAVLNYHNTIKTAEMMMNRMTEIGFVREFDKLPEQEEINDKPPRQNVIENRQNIEGIYHITIKDNSVDDSMNNEDDVDETIKEYALQLSERNNKEESGIIDKYVYNVKRRGENIFDITLMENEDAISHANSIQLISVILCILSIIAIYIGAKKISKIIVKPVEQTFEKQKQFISDASHELKTPLAVIEANADVLESEFNNNKWIKYIQSEIESMNKLINELLMLAKIENIDNLREIKQIDISKEIKIITAMFESMAYEKEVTIKDNVKENIMLKANKEDIEHIVSTLLDNAIKHTEKKKEVIVELNKEKNDIVIQIKNYGKPIPEEEREKIFERFYRIDKSRNRKEKRYGLGLAIAKSTVQKYKGKIEVLYKDHYTIFKVKIPN